MRCRVALLAGAFVLTASFGLQPSVSAAGLMMLTNTDSRPDASGNFDKADPLDLNTATAQQLRALPGMGDAYVRRILEGRPYTAKNQLTTRGILPQSAYEAIRERVVAHRPPRQP